MRLAFRIGFWAAAAIVSAAQGQEIWGNASITGMSDSVWSVAAGPTGFAAVTDQGKVLSSADGLTWSQKAVSPGTWLVSIAYGNGLWIAVGDHGVILTSPDLQTWQPETSGTTNRLNGVGYNGYSYLTVGENGTILESPDAHAWTLTPSDQSGYFHGITSGSPGDWLIGGQGGAMEFTMSVQGGQLFGANSMTSQDIEAVVEAPTAGLVAVGANGMIRYNPNGVPREDILILYHFGQAWQAADAPATTARFRGLAFGNGGFVAAGEQGTLDSSPDGIHWVQRPLPEVTADLLGAAYSASLHRFVVVGTAGTILVSDAVPSVFVNISSRGQVSPGNPLIDGFVISGKVSQTVLIRADGPALATFDVTNPLPDPVLTIYDITARQIAQNVGWTLNNDTPVASASAEVGAFPLSSGSADAALVLTLPPGGYTAVVTSAGRATGTVLLEAYTVP